MINCQNFVLTVGAGYNCDNGLYSTQTHTHTQILSLFDQTQITGMWPRRPKVTSLLSFLEVILLHHLLLSVSLNIVFLGFFFFAIFNDGVPENR